jgi:DNA-binding Lrp family transcriptional regulator
LEVISKMQCVVEGHVVSGDWDMIAVVTGETDEEAIKNSIEGFEGVPGVRKTETMASYQSFSCTISQKH